MGDSIVELLIYYGGKISGGDICSYKGGQSKVVDAKFDLDLLSYPNVMSYVQELGFSENTRLYYKKYDGGDFIEVKDDHLMKEISSQLKHGDKLEFFIEREVCDVEKDGEVLVEADCIPMYTQHQTFDDILINIANWTDDEDEELQEARRNVRNAMFEQKSQRNVGAGIVDGGDKVNDDIIRVPEETRDDDSDGNDSVYYSSSDCGSLFSEDDDEYGEPVLRRSKKKIWFDNTSRIPVFCLEMKFKNLKEVREAIALYAILKCLGVHLVKNDSERVRAECKQGCPWKLLVSKHSEDNTFTVKSYYPHHKCYRVRKIKFCNAEFLAKFFKQRIMSQPNIKIREFRELVRNELKLHVSKHVCVSAKNNIISEMKGSYIEEYGSLHDYASIICKTNPGSTCFAKSSSDNLEGVPKFTHFYICLDACKRGWIEGCRQIIGLDGCFLKGICKGQLLCAIGRDGNNQMFPIAWAVVQLETKDTWGWFLRCLKHDLPLDDGDGYTVISDMQKGLEFAMIDILPNAEHRMCARHVYSNWAKNWRGEERKLAFWNCARATFAQDLKEKLKVLEELGNGIVQDVLKYNLEGWCKTFFKTDVKCDVVDNNLAETFNGWILDARCKSIVSMLEEIRVKVMTRLWKKRVECQTWIVDIAPRAMKKLEKNKEKSFDWAVEWNGDSGYEVAKLENRKLVHTVDIEKRACSCREWDLTGIPCQHAVCALYSNNYQPEQFVDHWYTKHTFLKAYAYCIQTVPGSELWEPTGKEKIQPPEFRKMPGRPPKNRKKDRNEVKKIGTISKVGRKMRCGICKEYNHNSRRCPQKKKMDKQHPPVKRKRKTKDGTSATNGSNQCIISDITNEFCLR